MESVLASFRCLGVLATGAIVFGHLTMIIFLTAPETNTADEAATREPADDGDSGSSLDASLEYEDLVEEAAEEAELSTEVIAAQIEQKSG